MTEGTGTGTGEGTGTGTGTADKPWFEGKPADFIGTLENRGVKDKTPVEVALHFWEAHRNATQALSKFGSTDPAKILAIPKDWNNQQENEAFYGRLRPAKKEEYEAEGDDAADFRETAYDLGLTTHQAAKLHAWMKEGKTAEATEAATKTAEQVEALRREEAQHRINWAGKYDDNDALAVIGLKKQFGMTDEQIAAARKQPGFSKLFEGALRYAQATGEDKFSSGGGNPGAQSYEQAKAVYENFIRTPNGPDAIAYTTPTHPRHTEVRKEIARVLNIITQAEARQRNEEWRLAA